MGFFGFLFGSSDPTSTWVEDEDLELEFDFTTHALCGVRLGEPIDRLSRLGPVEDPRAVDQGELCYYSKGLLVEVTEGRISGFLLFWADEQLDQFEPFAGRCVHHGRVLMLNDETDEGEILSLWGKPYWRDESEDGFLLFYEHDDVEWQVELSTEGQLNMIAVQSPPLLADPQQRQAYRVTNTWPPTKA